MKKNVCRWAAILTVGVSLIAFTGCGGQQTKEAEKKDAPVKESTELCISAAASLTDVMKEIGTKYEAAHPGMKITYNFGSSGALQSQIEEGAPADVFVSAAQQQMDALEKKDLLIKDTRKDLLENAVVVIVPKDSKLELASIEEIATDKVKKIALGEPKGVPVGQYSEEVFKSVNLLEQVKAKAVYGSDVRQVLTWVENGEVDCGIVYATDAAISKNVRILMTTPDSSHKPVVYPAAVVKATKNEKDAKDFMAFLSTPEIKALFEKYGFQVK